MREPIKKTVISTPPPRTAPSPQPSPRGRGGESETRKAIMAALAGTSALAPIPTEKLYPIGGSRAEVEAALQSMYGAFEVGCCKITRGGVTRIVWWIACGGDRTYVYGRKRSA